jgi:hypothetical protein
MIAAFAFADAKMTSHVIRSLERVGSRRPQQPFAIPPARR